MLRLRRFCATCTLVLACLFALAALQSGAAQAQDKKPETQSAKKKTPRLTVTISPTWIFSTSGDVDSPPAPGWKGIGYTNDNPIVDTARVDWAVDYLFAPKWHVYANENYYAYQLSRITTLAPKTAFVSGSILDTWQNFGVSTAPFTDLSAHLSYFNHQRSDVTGLCLNQMECPVNGVQQVNPLSINSHGYEFGLSYDFGPKFPSGKLFNVTWATDYYNRPSTGPTGYATGGLCCWVGSTVEFPYSITARLPLVPDPSIGASITYLALPVLYEDSAVPEDYRGIVWGVSKAFSPNVSIGYTNFNLMSCKCVPRVPPPGVLQLTWGQVQLSLHDSF